MVPAKLKKAEILEGKSASVFVMILRTQGSLEILLVKNKTQKKETPDGKVFIKPGKFGLPGGARERGETDIDAAKREIPEETGLKIKISGPMVKEQKSAEHTVITLLGEVVGGKLKKEFRPEDEIEICLWFPLSRLPADMYRSHFKMIMEMRRKVGF